MWFFGYKATKPLVEADTRKGGNGWTFNEEDLIPWSANEEAYWKMKLHLV